MQTAILNNISAKNLYIILTIVVLVADLSILLNIPFLRQIFGFLLLTFLPGLLILHILKLNEIEPIKKFVLSVGLSISFLILTGLFINTIYPFFGFSEPLSFFPLLITLNIFILALCTAVYYINKDISIQIFINNIKQISSPSALFLILLPFLSIFGAELINTSGDNSLLLLLMIIIALIILATTISKGAISPALYPLAVVTIAIALLFHSTLISYYLRGADIHYEYSLFRLIKSNSLWNPTIYGNLNATLSIVMLSPIYSCLLSMDGIWVFKIIYPLIFSLVPLILYQAYKEQVGELPAFLSSFFFMSFAIFFTEMTALARQEIAELFFALLILIIVDRKIKKIKSALLCIIFSASLIVSHYGLSYIYMLCLILALFLFYFMRTSTVNNILQSLRSRSNKFSALVDATEGNQSTEKNNITLRENRILTANSVVLYVIMTLAWYIYVSRSSVFNTIVCIGNQIQNSIFTEFLSPAGKDPYISMALGISGYPSLGYFIGAIVFDITQLFIIIGILRATITGYEKSKFNREYLSFSYTNLIVLLLCIAVPHFGSSLNVTRIYHIVLFFLAPFCILGGETVFVFISKAISHFKRLILNEDVKLPLISIILIVFFLFQTGFIFEVTNDVPLSYSLSYDEFACEFMYKQDFICAGWLSSHSHNKTTVYGDFGRISSYGSYFNDSFKLKSFPVSDAGDINITERNVFVYLRYGNILSNKIKTASFVVGRTSSIPLGNLTSFLDYKSKIYDNGGSEVYK